MIDFESIIERLVAKAAQAVESGEALKFSQAALNTAHAKQVLAQVSPSK
jgi:hypothetical protein